MSSFAVTVYPVVILPCPSADALEIAGIEGYQCVVKKGQFKTGELVAYVPEGSLVPLPLQEELGVVGRLSGSDKNRVKAVKLRGVLSQGLVLKARPGWKVGQDVTAELGVTKWEPPVPACVKVGNVEFVGDVRTVHYDVEALKKHQTAWAEVVEVGDEVVATEKVHGTNHQAIYDPRDDWFAVTSKGVGAKGCVYKMGDASNADNLYVRVARALDLHDRMRQVWGGGGNTAPLMLIGEVYGKGVQDLTYGADVSSDATIGYRVFDAYVGVRGTGRYLDDGELDELLTALALPRVPVLYRGPYDPPAIAKLVDGAETVSGRGLHIREGIVIRPTTEKYHPRIGRVLLKMVSEAYLTRQGGTEYN